MARIKNALTENGTIAGKASGLATSLLQSATGALSPFNNLGRYMTGPRAIIKVNSQLFGFAFAVTYSITTEQTENFVIDEYIATELMPSRITVTGTMSMLHVPGKGPTKQLIQSNVMSFLQHKYITIEIRDQMTDEVIFNTNKAVITNKQQTLNAGDLSTITLTWKALGWTDELGVPTRPSGAETK